MLEVAAGPGARPSGELRFVVGEHPTWLPEIAVDHRARRSATVVFAKASCVNRPIADQR